MKIALVWLCCIVLGHGLPPSAPTPAPEVRDSSLAPLFRQAWETVRDHFYDPQLNGLDWADCRRRYEKRVAQAGDLERAAAIINRMLAELETSHTRLYTRWDPEYYHLLDIFNRGSLGQKIRAIFPDGRVTYTGIGVRTEIIDGATFIRSVYDGGPAAHAGVRSGQRLLAIDGQDPHPIRSFLGKAGRTVRLSLQHIPHPSGTVELEVVPRDLNPAEFFLQAMADSVRVLQRNNSRIGYVHVWSYAGRQYQDLLENEIAFGTLSRADCLIIDLRDGWGGANASYLNLFNTKVPTMLQIDRNGAWQLVDFQWRKPAALLVNGGTRSGKEVLTFGFKKHNLGPVVGSTTAGAVTAGRLFLLQRDAVLYLAVADIRVDGVRLEGRGVEPDIAAPCSLPYRNCTELQLEAALEALSNCGD